ncbi:MAG: NAD(P)-dependent oxidoreductase [Spirochaetia bacterium]|nr:NAD(P)-dependent oxidoreductase [Spirochaetia bacterium]
MKVLVTGAFGNVGQSVLDELIRKGHTVRTLDIAKTACVPAATVQSGRIEIINGDLRDAATVQKAARGMDVVIHMAAVIPPLADKKPKLTESVNIGGTKNIVDIMENMTVKPKLIYTSSIAIYGDRRKNPMINIDDPVAPNPDDCYAKQKIECEKMIKGSGLTWAILRLTYIVSMDKLRMDPIMYRMPLETSIEICSTKDAGLAVATAVENDGVWGKVLNIAGGERCRTTYGEYIARMMELFGLGKDFPPAGAFAKDDFHCGFMDTRESQRLLNYQRCTLKDYYVDVRKRIGIKRFLMTMIRPFARAYILEKSPYFKNKN